MELKDFGYKLPDGLIATHPLGPRDTAKLLVVDRGTGKITHSYFYDLPNFLKEEDFLIFNKSRVIPARLYGKVEGKDIEILLTSPCHPELDSGMTSNSWQVMAKPGKRLKNGLEISFGSRLKAKVLGISGGVFNLRFNVSGDDFWREVDSIGEMPLPPYILKQRHEKHDEGVDASDYQTIYADKPGSVAAPTAGLHFTEDLLNKIKGKGCEIGFVDLHVGLGTFEPIRTENIEDHKIHSEYFEISSDLVERLNKAKEEGRRIIAVGTTTVRVLETVFGLQGPGPCEKTMTRLLHGKTNIYIYPGYEFGFVDAMITNFHLPKSSLLLLVSAFWTREKILEAYQQAIESDYRFYSYGDGMFII